MALFSWRKTKPKSDGKNEAEMSFLDHLEELRWHLVRSIGVILVFAIVLFAFRIEIIGGVFMSPFREDFVTYEFLCENFGQFCETHTETEIVQTEIPDSLSLNGFMVTEETVIQAPYFIPGDSIGGKDSVLFKPPPETIRKRVPVELKVGVDEIFQNGKMAGFKVQTESGQMVEIQAISPYEQFMKALLYAFLGGLILAFPYVSWELWRFIRPALQTKEVKKVRWNVLATSVLFFTGVSFGYFIILPFSVQFLSNFVLFEEAQNIWRIGDVVNFVLLLLFGTGFIFQLPVVVYYLSVIGFLTPQFLKKYRRHAIVVLLVLAAILTPPDPMSQVLIFFPLLGLYEIGIVISRRVKKRRDAEEQKEEEESARRRALLDKQDEEERKQKEAEENERKNSVKEKESLEEKDEDIVVDDASEMESSDEDVVNGEDESPDDDDEPDLTPPDGIFSRD